LIWLIFL